MAKAQPGWRTEISSVLDPLTIESVAARRLHAYLTLMSEDLAETGFRHNFLRERLPTPREPGQLALKEGAFPSGHIRRFEIAARYVMNRADRQWSRRVPLTLL